MTRQEQRGFIFCSPSLYNLGPTQRPIEWVPGAPSRQKSDRGVKLATHVIAVARLRMSS